jgi:hypothetical protein
MSVTRTQTWICDECGLKHDEVENDLRLHALLSTLDIPRGWAWFDGRLICPRHTIFIETRAESMVVLPCENVSRDESINVGIESSKGG